MGPESLVSIVLLAVKTAGDLHVHDPFGCAIIGVWRGQRCDVVRLAVVIPGNNLHKPRCKVQYLEPAVVP